MFGQKKILNTCIAASLIIHVSLFVFLQTHSAWFTIRPAPSKPIAHLEKVRPDQILKESFSSVAKIHKHLPRKESVATSFNHLPVVQKWPDIEMRAFPSENVFTPFVPKAFALQQPPLELFIDLPKDLIFPSQIETSKSSPPQLEQISQKFPERALAVAEKTAIAFAEVSPAFSKQDLAKTAFVIPLPSLPELPTLSDLDTVNLSSAFEVELSFFPRPEGTGYLFALTLIPHEDLEIPSLRQNLIFLIDRSNSIQQERLLATKAAVSKAIEELGPEDSFNVIAFDHKMEKLFPSFLKLTPEVLIKTNEFLSKIQLGSFFSPGDLYRPLFVTIPSFIEDDEIYTAILLTDGEGLSKKGSQETFIRDWTYQNQGRVSLYALSMETDAHLGTIDAACHFNKGRLIYANSHRGLKRKLIKLTQNIKRPIAKNITLKTISKNAKIEIYPNPTAPIYLDQPYVLLGSTDSPDDFILFVQGRLKNQWLNVKKTISFVNAKKGGGSLKSEWALQKAYQKYERYLIEGDKNYLTQAKELLEPFRLQVAFQ